MRRIGSSQRIGRGQACMVVFIHASEIRDFLKDVPDTPLRALPSFWEVAGNACSLLDVDTNGQPETIALSLIAPGPVGLTTNLVALGWDLAEQSNLKPFMRMTPAGKPVVDTGALWRAQAMHLQVCTFRDNNTQVWAYDVNQEGHFGLVRLGLGNTAFCESELVSEGPGKPYELRRLLGKQSVVLSPDRIPEPWRAKYEKVVLGLLKAMQGRAGAH